MESFFISENNEEKVFKHCFEKKLPLLLKGPTGCGKSHLVQTMAEKLQIPLIKVACNEDTSAADLLGRYLIKGSETIWIDGPVTRAVRNGALLYLDEIAEAREDVIVALHSLTDHRRELYLDKTNEALTAPAHFMCIASFNPGYQRGFRELKPSTRQRFVNLSMRYLSPENEIKVLRQQAECSLELAEKIVRFATKIRNLDNLNLKETISTRLLIYTLTLHQNGLDLRSSAACCIAEALTDDIETTQALKDLINLSF